ncbi:MAG: acyl-CoA dehydrogenase [Steroidobacteraceae bacterium]
MTAYRPPIEDQRFVIEHLLGHERLAALCPEYSAETGVSILEEAGRFAAEVLAPLARPGDLEGAKWTPGGVCMPEAFRDAYRQFVAGGWPQLVAPTRYGGLGMPSVIGTATAELWGGADLSFKLCPMLTQGAIEALVRCASPALKDHYLPKLVSGEWTGTMNITEPQAGSDLAQIRTRAVPDGDRFRIFGQKIFITFGDHDFVDNIVHLVLARIEGAPPGIKGLSLFVVPKRLLNADGTAGPDNDVRCASIEHKLGIHASPTCVIVHGEKDGAIGELVGEPNRGLEYMFVMMNAARLSVGLEGFAVATRALNQATDFARTRIQSRAAGSLSPQPVPIIEHPDVRRMLLTMKSGTEAMRALALYAAFQLDIAEHDADEDQRARAQRRADLLIPIVKGWSTEFGNELAWLGVQVHGGMGFVEETGAAQWLRDVRITTIYEGTTGIQAADLVGRKLARDDGATMAALVADLKADLQRRGPDAGHVPEVREAMLAVMPVFERATARVLELHTAGPAGALAVSVPYVKLCGVVLGGWLMANAASAAAGLLDAGRDRDFARAKLQTARFYVTHVLPQVHALAAVIDGGADAVTGCDPALV